MTPLVMRSILVLLILIVLFNPAAQGSQLSRAMATGYGYVPSVNDAWVETLNKIEAESQPDAIINSWWDFGHWFKFWADRAVTFDGASQNDQRAHWIGKVLLTDDEDQAKRILQMLDCGGDRAQFNLYQITGDQYASVQLVYDFLEMEEQEVREELLTMTSEEKTQEIIDYMFCEPPENFFITSQDMVGKSGVWAHFGIWNFERARIYNYFKDQNQNEFVASLVSELDYSEEQAQRLYLELNSFTTDRQINDWIAPWPSYAGQAGCQKQDNTTLICGLPNQGQQIPLTIDLEEYEAYIENGEQQAHPNSFGYFDGDTFQVKEYDENRIGYSVVLSGNSLLLVQEDLVDSMFTRLFFLDGRGIENFEKFHDVTDVGGNRIITWKVNW